MMTIRRTFSAAALALAVTAVTSGGAALPAQAAAQNDSESAKQDEAQQAASFIRDLGNKAIEQLSDESISYEKRVQRFQQLVKDGFAMDAISRFVLGRYTRIASEAEKAAFKDVFLKVIAQRFLPLFEGYSPDDFIVEEAEADDRSSALFLVDSRVWVPNSDGMIKTGWRVRKKNNEMEIVDVLAEGVSMAITLRSEYNSLIQRNGGQVSALIAQLREKAEKGAFKSKSMKDAVQ